MTSRTNVRVSHNDKQKIRLLFCTREEADDSIQFHISHAVTADSVTLMCLQALPITTNSTGSQLDYVSFGNNLMNWSVLFMSLLFNWDVHWFVFYTPCTH